MKKKKVVREIVIKTPSPGFSKSKRRLTHFIVAFFGLTTVGLGPRDLAGVMAVSVDFLTFMLRVVARPETRV